MTGTNLSSLIAIGVAVLLFGFKGKAIAKARPLDPKKMWIVPGILLIVAGGNLISDPPPSGSWPICLFALLVGAVLGRRRGSLIDIWRDADTGNLMQKARPEAMVLMLVTVIARIVVRDLLGLEPAAALRGDVVGHALAMADALLLFAVGFLIFTRVEMTHRVRQILQKEKQS